MRVQDCVAKVGVDGLRLGRLTTSVSFPHVLMDSGRGAARAEDVQGTSSGTYVKSGRVGSSYTKACSIDDSDIRLWVGSSKIYDSGSA